MMTGYEPLSFLGYYPSTACEYSKNTVDEQVRFSTRKTSEEYPPPLLMTVKSSRFPAYTAG
jgi:hypothetical protein